MEVQNFRLYVSIYPENFVPGKTIQCYNSFKPLKSPSVLVCLLPLTLELSDLNWLFAYVWVMTKIDHGFHGIQIQIYLPTKEQ